ncbi:MFS general substrate transporter [Chloropicon primus]|uniref:MFS general substrate transporter n=2 Tax=Chloropicon primus TaxID=1764295 RepID=A0A5B8MDU3_9CHLO|nr:MFS general substrate transporter [Chloropicon primus]|eukprot:QDZ18778.1 MFS general substrate transporter [Chloropicon primus]
MSSGGMMMFKASKERSEETRGLIENRGSGASDAVCASLSGVGVETDGMSIDDVVTLLDWGPFHWLLLFQCGLSWACDAAEMMLLSFLVPRITPVLMPDASKEERDHYGFLLSAITFIGIWLGALVFGRVSDQLGRKPGYLISTAMVGFFGILCSFAQTMNTLIALRAVVGIGLGGVTCAVTLFSEVVAEKYRGAAIILSIGALWTFGCVFETCIAWLCFSMHGVQWRLFLVLSALPSLTLLTIFPWLVESPRYYLVHGRGEEAVQVLKAAAARNKVRLPDNLKLHAPKKPAAGGKSESHLKTLLGKKYRTTTVLLWGLWFCSVISYYGLCFVTPLYFSFQHQNEYAVTLLSALAEIPGMVATSYLVDRIGRKRTKAVMFSIGGIATFVLSVSSLPFGVLTLAAIVGRGSVLGAFNDLYVYTPEVYPTSSRAFGLGLCSAVARIAGIIVSYISFANESASEAASAVLVYSLCSFAGAVISMCLPIETKGRRLDGNEVGGG